MSGLGQALERYMEAVQEQAGSGTLDRATVFQAMSTLMQVKTQLTGIPPEGTQSLMDQAIQSIMTAHEKLNLVSARMVDSFREALYMDSTYTGPRWRYGLNYRPLGFGQVPDGWIVQSDRKDPKFRHGTVDYPHELPADKVKRFELTPLGKVS